MASPLQNGEPGEAERNHAAFGTSSRRYLSRRHVAELFGVSVSTVTRWAQRGLLKTIRTPGGHYRFPAEETRRAVERGVADLPREG